MATKRIVCAAIKRRDVVALGARHYDEFMLSLLALPEKDDEQGFIVIESGAPGTKSFTRFVDRKEAYRIARAARQLFAWADHGDEGLLHSEAIY
jgi:hypothetical protein